MSQQQMHPLEQAETQRYQTMFDARREEHSREPIWLGELRSRAMEHFVDSGFPTQEDEDWRFTSLGALRGQAFAAPSGSTASSAAMPSAAFAIDGPRLVFVDGIFAPHLSDTSNLPRGVAVAPISSCLDLAQDLLGGIVESRLHAPTALNTALFDDGAFVGISREALVGLPIYVLNLSLGQAVARHPRMLVHLEAGSQASIIEHFAGSGEHASFTNAVTEIALQEGAALDHFKVQAESLSTFHLANTQARLQRNSRLTSHYVSLGGCLVRNEVRVLMAGSGTEATLNGLYVAAGKQHMDNYTVIDHASPHCASHEHYKGILADKAHGVFNGKIFVRQDAQKTDAKQTNRTLLLSDDATINTKPQLEIFADDVKCTHGATVGQLDDVQLFYLRSRGIPLAAARSLLTFAFANDITSRIQVPAIREQLQEVLLARNALPLY